MGTQKGANWVFGRDVKGVEASPGVERRVLAYCDELMCVENVFQKGSIGAMHHHPHTQITYVAVSYTHLDVYKRQDFCCAIVMLV